MDRKEERSKEEVLAGFIKNDKGQYVYKLKEPIIIGSETKKELTLDKPKAKHIRKMSTQPGMDDILVVIGKLSNESNTVIDELCIEDMNVLAEYFAVFS